MNKIWIGLSTIMKPNQNTHTRGRDRRCQWLDRRCLNQCQARTDKKTRLQRNQQYDDLWWLLIIDNPSRSHPFLSTQLTYMMLVSAKSLSYVVPTSRSAVNVICSCRFASDQAGPTGTYVQISNSINSSRPQRRAAYLAFLFFLVTGLRTTLEPRPRGLRANTSIYHQRSNNKISGAYQADLQRRHPFI